MLHGWARCTLFSDARWVSSIKQDHISMTLHTVRRMQCVMRVVHIKLYTIFFDHVHERKHMMPISPTVQITNTVLIIFETILNLKQRICDSVTMRMQSSTRLTRFSLMKRVHRLLFLLQRRTLKISMSRLQRLPMNSIQRLTMTSTKN